MEKFKYTDENLRKLQLIELDMLKELDRICRKHSINYILDAGTLLGAVRYGGFIPWDDDVDVRMLREDYEKFCSVCSTELDKKYFLQTYQTDHGYRWLYGRILKNGTVYSRKNHEMLQSKNGIFIDIFPVDKIPEKKFQRQYFTFCGMLCRKMLYSEVGCRIAKNRWKRAVFHALNLVPKNRVYAMYGKLVYRCSCLDTDLVRTFGWGSKEENRGYSKKWMEKTCDIIFEDYLFKAPVQTEEFLVHFFGKDYMIPPPEAERVPGHIADYIKFE